MFIKYKRMAPNEKALERYIKLLEVCNNPTVTRAILKTAPESVIKTICNAALNCYRGDVQLSPKQKHILKRFRKQIEALCSKSIGIKFKRRILVQKGGAIWIPLLIGSVLTTLGHQIFSKL